MESTPFDEKHGCPNTKSVHDFKVEGWGYCPMCVGWKAFQDARVEGKWLLCLMIQTESALNQGIADFTFPEGLPHPRTFALRYACRLFSENGSLFLVGVAFQLQKGSLPRFPTYNQ